MDIQTRRARVYEVEPFRTVWLVRRRGSREEQLYTTREAAVERGYELCRLDGCAELVIRDRTGMPA